MTTADTPIIIHTMTATSGARQFLTTVLLLSGLARPTHATEATKPFFPFRGWETQVDGLWCAPRGGSDQWYKNPVYLAYLDTVLREAPAYDANALILMGRHDDAEIHTFIEYVKWPLLHSIYRHRHVEDRRLQLQRLNDLIAKAVGQGVEVYLWDHEIHIPSELPRLYPVLAGDGAAYCPNAPDLWRFINDKYEEFLQHVPGIGGVFLVFSETQSVLLDGSPCQCERCRSSCPEGLLERLIRAVHGPLKKRGKRLVVRTFGHSRQQEQTIVNTINRLPPDLDVTVMSKATSCDFYGSHYPDHPAIGAVKGRPQFLEEAFGEYRGKTNIICTPAEFYRQRIRHAAAHGLQGIVVRLDHNGYPKSNFETPNRFNIHFVSKLWNDPDAEPEAIWQQWFSDRYGPDAAKALMPAFRATQQIWDQSTNTLGVYVNSAHGNLAPLFSGPYNAWDNLNDSVSKVTTGIGEWDALGRQLLNPSDDTMQRIAAEIGEAERLADEAVEAVRKAAPSLSTADRDELNHYFRLARATARLFGRLKTLFFLSLRADQSTGQRRSDTIRQIVQVSQEAFEYANGIEREFGYNHWPLAPDDGRGSNLYDILTDYWTNAAAALQQGKPLPKGGWQRPPTAMSSPARLYRALLEVSRPGAAPPKPLEFALDRQFRETAFQGNILTVTITTGHTLTWPLPCTVVGPTLTTAAGCQLRIAHDSDRLVVSADPTLDLNRSMLDYQNRRQQQDQAVRDALHTEGDFDAYKARVRENFCDLLGPWPERTPLNPQIVGTLDRTGYRVEKILIESQPHFYVPINLYVPTDRPTPMPALLSPLGHAPNGKAYAINDSYQAMFVTLARKGYVVCVYDPLGQGEREPYGAPTGNHHQIQGYQCMPSGRHLALYFIWDGIRCLDYLESRTEVDRTKIACSGCSGGGALTNYIVALDDRVAVAVPAAWIAESTYLTWQSAGLHTESWFPDMCAPYGPGTTQLLACIAPRPLLILTNDDDPLFPPSTAEVVYRETAKTYDLLGVRDRLEYVHVPTRHGFWPEARRELYRFVNACFGKAAEGCDEPPFTPEREEDLFCAPGGQVRNLPEAQTVYSLNRALMADLRAQRQHRRQSLAASDYRVFVRHAVLQTTFYCPATQPVRARDAATFPHQTPARRRLLLEYEPGFTALADFYAPDAAPNAPAAVLIADDNAAATGLAADLAARGVRILHLHTQTADPRHEIMAGKPRCGRWATLALRGVEYLRSCPDSNAPPAAVIGIGHAAALAAQFAAILEPRRVAAVVAIGALDSVESLAERIDESHPLQMTIPAALRGFDESDLPAVLVPKPVLIAATRNKGGSLLSQPQLAQLHHWALQSYQRQACPERFTLSAAPFSPGQLADWLRRTSTLAPDSRDSRSPSKE